MSKADMIGSINRALPEVHGKHVGLVRDLVRKLGGVNADGVHRTVAAALVKRPPPAVLIPVLHVRLNELRTATVFENGEDQSVPEMFQEILGLPLGMPSDVIAFLAQRRGYALTEAQADWMFDTQNRFLRGERDGKDVGLRASAWPNFIAIDGPDGTARLEIARHGKGQWHRYPHPFDEDTVYLEGARVIVGSPIASGN